MIELIRKLSESTLARNYLKVFSVDVLVKASGIVLLPVYLRLMTQEEFGLYGYLMAVINTFSLVFNLGIYAAQSKLYHEYPADRRGSVLYTLNALLLLFISLLLLLIFVFRIDFPIIHFLFKDDLNYEAYRIPVLLGVTVSVYSLMLVNYFLTSENIRKLQQFNILRIVAVNLIVLALLFFWTSGDHALIRLQYSFVAEGIIILAFSWYYVSRMKPQFDKEAAQRALKISLPVVVSAVLGLFINLSDRYFIEKYGTLKDMSVYNLALTVAGIIPFVFASFQNIWLPQFLKERDLTANRERARRMTWRLLFIFIVLSLLILLLLKILLLTHIISQKYDAIMPLLPWVLMTTILASLTPMFSNHLIYLEKLYLVIVVGIPIAVIGILLNSFLVPRYNLYGAAITTLITNGCYLLSYALLVNYFYRKNLTSQGSVR